MVAKKYVTHEKVYANAYTAMDRQRELLAQMIENLPVNQVAMMRKAQAAKYLGVHRSTLERYAERGILKPIIHPTNGYWYYYVGHLWVFKNLWMTEEANGRAS